ncbi:MAG: glycosyltransferase [Phycisphaerales bacterium]|nr:glycosyltransferase [Phycisphaerales bacterium]
MPPGSQISPSRPTVLGVERINNPHIIPIFDELYRQPDIDFTGCVLGPLDPPRVALGWPDIDASAPYIQPWRNQEQLARYHRLAREADIVIWPGLKHPRGLRMIVGRNLRRQINVIWAERFLGRRRRSWLEYLAMRLTVRLVNSTNMHLMTMGENADTEHRAFGATRWNMWRFGYAVRPVRDQNIDLTTAPDGQWRLLFVSGLFRHKGLDLLLRALAGPSLVQHSWRLQVVGDGPERQALASLAAELGIAAKVNFAGRVGRDSIDAYYRQADILLLPSRFDGWGATVNEGMEYGLAIVTSDAVGSSYMLIEPGVNGFVFPNGSVEGLAESLEHLITKPGLCAAMRQAARHRIQRFRPAEAARRFAAICRGLTGHGPMPDFHDDYGVRL